MMTLLKIIIALNLYIGMNVWQWKFVIQQSFCVKNNYLQHLLYFVHKCSDKKYCFGKLKPQILIARNKATTKKASRKKVHDKVFLNFLTNGPFFTRKWGGTIKNNITLNLYMGINGSAYSESLLL